MLRALKEFFEEGLGRSRRGEEDAPAGVELAAAVLMVEISMADSELTRGEREVIERALRERFHLDADTARELVSMAEAEVDHAVSLYDFTRAINAAMTPAEKTRIVELLWQVAFADALLDKYEEYYIRKIADLLYVSHGQFIRTKHRAAKRRA